MEPIRVGAPKTEPLLGVGSLDKIEEVTVKDGLIRLPHKGAAFKVTLTTSAGKRIIDPNNLSPQEQKLLTQVSEMLTQAQDEKQFAFMDLKETKITHEGIALAGICIEPGNYKGQYQTIQDTAEKILRPVRPEPSPPPNETETPEETPPADKPAAKKPGPELSLKFEKLEGRVTSGTKEKPAIEKRIAKTFSSLGKSFKKTWTRVRDGVTGLYNKVFVRKKAEKPSQEKPVSLDEEAKKIAGNLSGKHPLKNDLDVLKKVIFINNPDKYEKTNVTKLTEEILNKIKGFERAEWKDDIIRLLSDSGLKRGLRLKLGLLKEEDLVCELSQGRINPSLGRNACASICVEAIFTLAKGEQIDTEQKMYKVIKNGIAAHQTRGFGTKQVFFEELATKIQENGGPQHLEAHAPQDESEGIYSDTFKAERASTPSMYPFLKEVEDGFTDLITTLKTLSDKREKTLYGVITCEGHTVVVYFDKGNPVLFDSAGNEYRGVNMGASILKFDTLEAIDTHLKSKYKGNSDFSMLMVEAKFS
ncbi:MAG: hypothetical protein K940chlam7_02017 [Chlamydiae bacterium]|nr:hypothetical protein [Chlamydiota bacterium]